MGKEEVHTDGQNARLRQQQVRREFPEYEMSNVSLSPDTKRRKADTSRGGTRPNSCKIKRKTGARKKHIKYKGEKENATTFCKGQAGSLADVQSFPNETSN